MKPQNLHEHVDYQKCYFDANVDFFRQPIPEDIQQRTQEIIQAVRLKPQMKVLDVGTGVGVLIGHLLDSGLSAKAINACDLSSEMLAEAKKRYPEVNFWQGNILEYPQERGPFAAIFFNACFGNFFDQFATIEYCTKMLSAQGKIIISHPLGNAFVLQLKNQDPRLVLKQLPDREELKRWSEHLDLNIDLFRDEEQLYLAILQRQA